MGWAVLLVGLAAAVVAVLWRRHALGRGPALVDVPAGAGAGASTSALPLFLGPFRIQEAHTSAGHMARALIAEDHVTGEPVFIKWVPAQPDDPVGRGMLSVESKVLSVVSGPSLPVCLGTGVAAEGAWLALRRIQGGNLERRVADGGPLDLPGLRRLQADLADALHRLHSAGWVHGDVKPANVLWIEHGQAACLIDLGLATPSGEPRSKAAAFVGSPAFLAPELIVAPGAAVSPAVDAYGMGATLWFAAVGRAPFGGESIAQVLHAATHAPLPDLAEQAPHLPTDLREQIVSLLERDPARRRIPAACAD